MDNDGAEQGASVCRRQSELDFTPSVALQGRNVMCTSTMIKVTYNKPVSESPSRCVERLAAAFCPRGATSVIPLPQQPAHSVERAPPPNKPIAILVSRETPCKALPQARPVHYYPFMLTGSQSLSQHNISSNKENVESDGGEQLENLENDGRKQKGKAKRGHKKQWIEDNEAIEKYRKKRGRRSRRGEALPPEESIIVQKESARRYGRKRKSKSEIILDEAIGITEDKSKRKVRLLPKELPEIETKSKRKTAVELAVSDLKRVQKKRKTTMKDSTGKAHDSFAFIPRRSGRMRTAIRFHDLESEAEDAYECNAKVPSRAALSETRRKSVQSPWQGVLAKAVDICERLHKESLDEEETAGVVTRKSKRGKKRSRTEDEVTPVAREKSTEYDSEKSKERGRRSRRHRRHHHKDKTLIPEEGVVDFCERPRKRKKRHEESPGPPVAEGTSTRFQAKSDSPVDVQPMAFNTETPESLSAKGRKKRVLRSKDRKEQIVEESNAGVDSVRTSRRLRAAKNPKNSVDEPSPKRRGRPPKLVKEVDSRNVDDHSVPVDPLLEALAQYLSRDSPITRGKSKSLSKNMQQLPPDLGPPQNIPVGEEYRKKHDQSENISGKKVRARRGEALKEQSTSVGDSPLHSSQLSRRWEEKELAPVKDVVNQLDVCEENSMDDPLVAQMAQLERESVIKPNFDVIVPVQSMTSGLCLPINATLSESVTARTSQTAGSEAPQPLVSAICPSLNAELPQQKVTEITLPLTSERLPPTSQTVGAEPKPDENFPTGTVSVKFVPETVGAKELPVGTNLELQALNNEQYLSLDNMPHVREQTPDVVALDPLEKSTPPKKRGRRKLLSIPYQRIIEKTEIHIPAEVVKDFGIPPALDTHVAGNTEPVCVEPPTYAVVKEIAEPMGIMNSRGLGLREKGKNFRLVDNRENSEVNSEDLGVDTVVMDFNTVMFDPVMVVAGEEVVEAPPVIDLTVTEKPLDSVTEEQVIVQNPDVLGDPENTQDEKAEVCEIGGGIREVEKFLGEGIEVGEIREVEGVRVEDLEVGAIREVEVRGEDQQDILEAHYSNLPPEIIDENGLSGKKPKKEKKKKKKQKKHKRAKSTEPEKFEWAPLKVKNGSTYIGMKDRRQLVVSLEKLDPPKLDCEKPQVLDKSDSGRRKSPKKYNQLRKKPKPALERENCMSGDEKEKPKIVVQEEKLKDKSEKEKLTTNVQDELEKLASMTLTMKENHSRVKIRSSRHCNEQKVVATKSSGPSHTQKRSKRLEHPSDTLVKKKYAQGEKPSVEKKHRHKTPEKEAPKQVIQEAEPPVDVSPIGTSVVADRPKSIDEKPRTPKSEQPNNSLPVLRPKTPKPEPFGLKSPRDRSVVAASATPQLAKDSKGVRIVQCVDMFSGLTKPQVRKERKEAKAVAKRPHVVVPSLFAPDPPAPATRPSRPSS